MLDSELLKNAQKKVEESKELQKAGLICLDGQFFPSVHYPPITMYSPVSEEELFKGYENPKDGFFVLYAHIPFCIKYCTFCHYPNLIGELIEEKDRYLATIDKEMGIYMNRLGLAKIKARSILVGGGTPTYLTLDQLKRFLDSFTSKVDLASCTQFNYDVDPFTLLGPEGTERLKILRSYGVNRLTIGFQSLNDHILKMMNRPHDAAEAIESVRQSRAFGFQLNIEFIFGYPGETLETWTATMEQAVTLDVDEIQLYRLKVIPYGDHAGFIQKKYAEKGDHFPTLEETLMMKEIAHTILRKNGFNENLTRVFSKKPEFFSHYAADQCCNLVDQIGFGITGFSSMRDRFGLNTQDFKEYYSLVGQGKLSLNRGLVRTRDDQTRWHIILPLKNRKVFKAFFQKRTGLSLNDIFRKKIERLKSFNLIHEDDKVLGLTPLGRFFADEVCEQFSSPKYIPFPKAAYADGPLNPYNDSEP